jgi:hypothetical protein
VTALQALMSRPAQFGDDGESAYCLVIYAPQSQSQLPLGAAVRCQALGSPIPGTAGLHTCVVPLQAVLPPFAHAPSVFPPTLQTATGTLSTMPSQSSSVPGLAHVSVLWGVTCVQVPHALDDLSADTTHACEPAEQMPLNSTHVCPTETASNEQAGQRCHRQTAGARQALSNDLAYHQKAPFKTAPASPGASTGRTATVDESPVPVFRPKR